MLLFKSKVLNIWYRLRVVPIFPHFSLCPPRLAFLAWGDFNAHSRFARSTIPDKKWGLLVVYIWYSLPRIPLDQSFFKS